MELTLPGCSAARSLMQASSDHSTDEAAPTDHFGIRAALLWLVVGSALVGTAIVALGWRRTVEIWAVSGVALALLFVGERLWYKYVGKSD
jgi:hypothetical protein